MNTPEAVGVRAVRDKVPGARWRTALLGVGVLAFTAALLWGSDWLARLGAQSLIARSLQEQTGALDRPDVTLHGTFFLTQVVHGVYDDVEVDLHPVVSGPLRIDRVHAELQGVHLPFHDVLVRKAQRIVVDHSVETATLRYDDLDHYLAATGNPLSFESAPGGAVRLVGTASILGQRVSASADVKVAAAADQGALAITPVQFNTGIGGLTAVTRILLGQRFTVTVPLRSLPLGQSIAGIDVQPQRFVVHARGDGIVIEQ